MVSEIAYVISLRHLAMDKLIAAEDPVPLPAAGISSAARHFPSPGHNVRGIHRLHSPLSPIYGILWERPFLESKACCRCAGCISHRRQRFIMFSRNLSSSVLSICISRILSYETSSELCSISSRYFGSIARKKRFLRSMHCKNSVLDLRNRQTTGSDMLLRTKIPPAALPCRSNTAAGIHLVMRRFTRGFPRLSSLPV